ncbi:DNA-directed RNA polymerases I, II, and III subunit RPABC1 [Artemisia annua]|uniref:DNA-directed RNA polymerases I, II, and III subunit RPABC1 n=1 Tax=Artemisia annua TaxID=35608 RepID=A0A2U1KCG3_ARTAN|nr:DNA-directed RNA polymerases I, II, and III subunit RPABC1 [Artemisia annua]
MSLPDSEITRLHRIRKTCFEMLKDRGYEVEDSEIDMSRKEFIDMHNGDIRRENLTINKSKPGNTDQIRVFFPDDLSKIGVGVIKKYLIVMEHDNVRRAIIVVRTGLTPSAKASQSEVAGKFQIEVFQEAELLVNIRYHNLVPDHVPLTDDEKKALLNKYTVKEPQLPRILASDPVARYYGLRRGQVVKILRPIETGTSERDKDDFESNKRDRENEICYVTYRIVG